MPYLRVAIDYATYSADAIALDVYSSGMQWHVGFPFRHATREERAAGVSARIFPTAAHAELFAWWPTDAPALRTLDALLGYLDREVARRPPPVALRLSRLGETVREYPAA